MSTPPPKDQPLPDLYDILHVEPTANPDTLLRAYKRKALQSHPDFCARLGESSRQFTASARTAFTLLNQAYYILSDPDRRAAYDAAMAGQRARSSANGANKPKRSVEDTLREVNQAMQNSVEVTNYTAVQSAMQAYLGVNPLVTHMFDEVFEPMIAAEMEAMAKEAGVEALPGTSGSTWAMAGLLSGAVVGFMVSSIPGAAFGGMAGYRIGVVRDRTGVPVMQAFYNMSPEQRGNVLRRLAGGPVSKLMR